MGLTVLTIEVANPAALERRAAVEFLVDSGAVDSFVPRVVLAHLGIEPHGRERFRLADGSAIERQRGDAVFIYGSCRGAAPVIFGEPGDATLLGAVTLESLGLVLDVIRRDLRSRWWSAAAQLADPRSARASGIRPHTGDVSTARNGIRRSGGAYF